MPRSRAPLSKRHDRCENAPPKHLSLSETTIVQTTIRSAQSHCFPIAWITEAASSGLSTARFSVTRMLPVARLQSKEELGNLTRMTPKHTTVHAVHFHSVGQKLRSVGQIIQLVLRAHCLLWQDEVFQLGLDFAVRNFQQFVVTDKLDAPSIKPGSHNLA